MSVVFFALLSCVHGRIGHRQLVLDNDMLARASIKAGDSEVIALFIRHGESTKNAMNIAQKLGDSIRSIGPYADGTGSSKDAPLTQKGYVDALNLYKEISTAKGIAAPTSCSNGLPEESRGRCFLQLYASKLKDRASKKQGKHEYRNDLTQDNSFELKKAGSKLKWIDMISEPHRLDVMSNLRRTVDTYFAGPGLLSNDQRVMVSADLQEGAKTRGGDAKSKIESEDKNVRNIITDPAKKCKRQCQALRQICGELSGLGYFSSCINNADCNGCLKSVIAYLNGRYNSDKVQKGYNKPDKHYVDASDTIGLNKESWKAYNLQAFPRVLNELSDGARTDATAAASKGAGATAITDASSAGPSSPDASGADDSSALPPIAWLSGHSNNIKTTVVNFATAQAKAKGGSCHLASKYKVGNGGVLAVDAKKKTGGQWQIVGCHLVVGKYQEKKWI